MVEYGNGANIMDAKRIEIRDYATVIPALAVRIDGSHWLERRAGYDPSSPYILLTRLQGGNCCCDPHDWSYTRTMRVAHEELIRNWDKYADGDLVDVRFVLGEVEEPCESEHDY